MEITLTLLSTTYSSTTARVASITLSDQFRKLKWQLNLICALLPHAISVCENFSFYTAPKFRTFWTSCTDHLNFIEFYFRIRLSEQLHKLCGVGRKKG